MKLLGIDTSTAYSGIDLYVDGTHATHSWFSRHNHGRELMREVAKLLRAGGISPSELHAVVVATGPGGFSSVRVGIATAQGLVAATGVPMFGVPTHMIACSAHSDEADSKEVVSLIGVGRNQVSYGIYRPPILSLDDEIESGICDAHEVVNRFDADAYVFCGEWIQEKRKPDLSSKPGLVRPPELMLKIALHWMRNDMVPCGPVEPIYARPPTITPPRNK